MRKNFAVAAAIAVLMTGACSASNGGSVDEGSDYPSQPIQLIVPFEPGASADVAARMWASYASKKFGQPVNVVNVSGASGITGMLQAERAQPDGYTLLVDAATTSSALYALRDDMPGELDDRTFVIRLTSDPYFFFACNGTDWTTLQEALDAAKANPDDFTWAAGAQASNPMLAQLGLFEAAGVDVEQTRTVIFDEGNSPSLEACASGDVDFAAGSSNDVDTYVQTGRMTALATTHPEPVPGYEDIPTTKSLGYGEANWHTWYGIAGPPDLPDSVIDAWADVFDDVASDPAAQKAASDVGVTWSVMNADEFTDYVDQQYAELQKLAEETEVTF